MIARHLELPHPFVGGALFLAPWVTGKVPQLMHPPRKRKPGAILSSSHLYRRFKEGDRREASGQTVPSMRIGGITRYLDRATMTPEYGFGRKARLGPWHVGTSPFQLRVCASDGIIEAQMQFRLLRSSRGGPTSYPSALLLADAGLYTMHAPELLSFVDLFHHQHELGEDSAQPMGPNYRIGQPRYARRLSA
jgi:hypothetical protein